MSRIFISYKRVDKDKVFKIKDQIESALGEKCWIDLDGIESDVVFASKIIGAINNCEIVLFMYSKAHSKIEDYEKDWTIRELNFAAKKGKRIVFVNLDGSPLTDEFELDYGSKQQVDASSSSAVSHLTNDLKKWLATSSEIHNPQATRLDYKKNTNARNQTTSRLPASLLIMIIVSSYAIGARDILGKSGSPDRDGILLILFFSLFTIVCGGYILRVSANDLRYNTTFCRWAILLFSIVNSSLLGIWHYSPTDAYMVLSICLSIISACLFYKNFNRFEDYM